MHGMLGGASQVQLLRPSFLKEPQMKPKLFIKLDLDLDFLSFSEEIVSDGDKPMPCNPSTPETAPMGAYLCDANTSICLEKWTVSNVNEGL